MNFNFEPLKNNFDSIFRDNICSVSKHEEVLQVYLGDLSSDTVFSICGELENILKRKKFPKQLIKRSFFLALEVLQNQLLHGSKDENKRQYNFLVFTLDLENINIYACNLVKSEEVGALRERIQHVNQMLEEKSLRNLYMEQLTNNEFGTKGGGGLGFIKMALVTDQKIDFDFQSENAEYAFLNVKISLPRVNQDQLNNISLEEILNLLK